MSMGTTDRLNALLEEDKAKENLEKAKAQGLSISDNLSDFDATLRRLYAQWGMAEEPAQASMSIWALSWQVARTIFLGPERG